eukprot:1190626-Prorocentrum_minimum.AAC.2
MGANKLNCYQPRAVGETWARCGHWTQRSVARVKRWQRTLLKSTLWWDTESPRLYALFTPSGVYSQVTSFCPSQQPHRKTSLCRIQARDVSNSAIAN